MRTTFIFFIGLSICLHAYPQEPQQILWFQTQYDNAVNDDERINALADLAEYYTVFNLNEKADSVLQKALNITELSDDKKILQKILFNTSVTNFNVWSSQQTFEKSIAIIQKGLKYAEEINNPLLEAEAYIKLAGIYRRRNLFVEAVEHTSKAFSALANAKEKDSVEVELYCELGDIYLAKSNAVAACKNYNIAFEIAYRNKLYISQSKIYHRFSDLYDSFNNTETAKDYLMQSLKLNLKINYTEGTFLDYIGLAKITNKREYIEKAVAIAEQLKSLKYIIAAKRLMYYWFMVEGKKSSETFAFLQANPALIQCFKNTNTSALIWEKGNIYKYAGKYDSALFYYRMAEPDMIAAKNQTLVSSMYSTMAQTYLQNGEVNKSKEYYQKTLELALKFGQLKIIAPVSSALSKICAGKEEYAQAYNYSLQADSANNIIQANAGKDKMLMMQMDRENTKLEMDRIEIAGKLARKNNLQLMAITICISIFFIFMIFIGMFEVSKTVIKIIGYFAFISLFEFIILLLDHPIIDFTNGEPLKIWLCKILLIALLVPIQHFMEKRVIAYLQSRELLEARKHFSFKNLWQKKDIPSKNPVQENDTDKLVL